MLLQLRIAARVLSSPGTFLDRLPGISQSTAANLRTAVNYKTSSWHLSKFCLVQSPSSYLTSLQTAPQREYTPKNQVAATSCQLVLCLGDSCMSTFPAGASSLKASPVGASSLLPQTPPLRSPHHFPLQILQMDTFGRLSGRPVLLPQSGQDAARHWPGAAVPHARSQPRRSKPHLQPTESAGRRTRPGPTFAARHPRHNALGGGGCWEDRPGPTLVAKQQPPLPIVVPLTTPRHLSSSPCVAGIWHHEGCGAGSSGRADECGMLGHSPNHSRDVYYFGASIETPMASQHKAQFKAAHESFCTHLHFEFWYLFTKLFVHLSGWQETLCVQRNLGLLHSRNGPWSGHCAMWNLYKMILLCSEETQINTWILIDLKQPSAGHARRNYPSTVGGMLYLLAEASESHLEPQLCHLNSTAVFWLVSVWWSALESYQCSRGARRIALYKVV